jgi:hypothetical protein
MDMRAVGNAAAGVQILFTKIIASLSGKLGFSRRDTMQRNNNIRLILAMSFLVSGHSQLCAGNIEVQSVV